LLLLACSHLNLDQANTMLINDKAPSDMQCIYR
jgi:hypothetical protein